MASSKAAYSRGFTLIELMIASAIFIVIVTSGTILLITATNNYHATTEIRQALDTLSFAMEDMDRNIRLGTTFNCANLSTLATAADCPTSDGSAGSFFISMEPYDHVTGTNNDQVIYWIYSAGDPTQAALYKKPETDTTPISTINPSNAPFVQITPSDMYIDETKSGFIVTSVGTGSSPMTPQVTIRLAGTVQYHNTIIPFDVQSTVAPRDLFAQ